MWELTHVLQILARISKSQLLVLCVQREIVNFLFFIILHDHLLSPRYHLLVHIGTAFLDIIRIHMVVIVCFQLLPEPLIIALAGRLRPVL